MSEVLSKSRLARLSSTGEGTIVAELTARIIEMEAKLAETEAKLTSVLQGHRVVGIAGQVIIDLQAKLTEAKRRNVAALGAMKKVAEQTWGCRGEDSDAEDCYLNNAIKELEKPL